MNGPVVKILRKRSYRALIRNSAKGENHMFRNLYALIDGQERDVLQDGALSCAAFVSGLLVLSELMGRSHATVSGLERALEAEGWVRIPELRDGAVLIWEGITYEDGQTHRHAGFSVGNGRAVSNGSTTSRMPEEHSVDFNGTRNVQSMWWHPSLDE